MLRQYSRFVEIVRSYGHIDQLTSAAMVQIMEYIFVFTPCKRLAPTTKLPRILPGGFVVYDGHAVHLQRCDSAFHQNTAADDQNDTKEDQPGLWREEKRADRHCAENQQHKTDILGFLT